MNRKHSRCNSNLHFYGTVNIIIVDGKVPALFKELRDIDAAVILSPTGSRICINGFGLRAAQFLATDLWRIRGHRSVCDPEAL